MLRELLGDKESNTGAISVEEVERIYHLNACGTWG